MSRLVSFFAKCLIIVSCAVAARAPAARADDQRTICGHDVDGWLRIVRDKGRSPAERSGAVVLLGYFGARAERAVPELIKILEPRADPQLQECAIKTLGQIGPAARDAVPQIIKRVPRVEAEVEQGFSEDARTLCQEALAGIGAPAVPALIGLVEGPSPMARLVAVDTIATIGPAAMPAVPALIRVLETRNAKTDEFADASRLIAVIALGMIGPDARAAVPILKSLLSKDLIECRDDQTIPVEALITALDQIGSPPVTELLTAFRRDGDLRSAQALANLGPRALLAAPALRTMLSDQRPAFRMNASAALAHIEPKSLELIPILIEALGESGPEMPFALSTLGRLGPRAVQAVPAMLDIVKHGPSRNDAMRALVRIDPEGRRSLSAFVATLKDGYAEPDVRETAAECLGALGSAAKPAMPALLVRIARKPSVKMIEAVGRIDPDHRLIPPALGYVLRSQHAERRVVDDEHVIEANWEAAEASAKILGSLGTKANAAVPALIEIFEADEDGTNTACFIAAATALGRIGPDSREATQIFRDYLEASSPPLAPESVAMEPQVEDAAAVALFYLAPDGKEVAEKWAQSLVSPTRRAFVLGGIGRTSPEGDAITRRILERLDAEPTYHDGFDGFGLEDALKELTRLRVGARLAVARLTQLHDHEDPWIRLRVKEVLAEIAPDAKSFRR